MSDHKRYLTADVGKNQKGEPIAIDVQGYVSRQPFVKPAEGDKGCMVSFSIGINHSADGLMARAETGTFPEGDADSGFVTVTVFGEKAEKIIPHINVGVKVSVSGPMRFHEYTKHDGTKGKDLQILVNAIAIMGAKGVDPIISDGFAAITSCYTGKDGVTRTQSLACQLTGKVISTRELGHSASGLAYLPFGFKTAISADKVLDIVQGTYDKNSGKEYDNNRTIINCTVFGKAAEALQNIIRTDAELALTGPVESRTYNGKDYVQMRVRNCGVMKFAPRAEGEQAGTAAPAAPAAAGTVSAAAAPSAAPAGSVAAAASEQDFIDGNFMSLDDEGDDTLPF